MRLEDWNEALQVVAAEAALAIERADLMTQLTEQARTDALTGLGNRRSLEDVLAREIARSERTSDPLAVAMIDLDHFKRYNDENGHQAGDRLLKDSCAAWLNELRDSDFLGRYGGEEFVLILPGCDAETAVHVADRVRRAMLQGQTCSIGIAMWNGEDLHTLIDRADEAMYEAKRNGRNQVRI
jgi:diguanylate cyclase (GGDEF)-like protein